MKPCPFCESGVLTLRRNVGYDIWPGGSEDQHIERCVCCGAWRLICDGVTTNEETGTQEPFRSQGKWHDRKDHLLIVNDKDKEADNG